VWPDDRPSSQISSEATTAMAIFGFTIRLAIGVTSLR